MMMITIIFARVDGKMETKVSGVVYEQERFLQETFAKQERLEAKLLIHDSISYLWWAVLCENIHILKPKSCFPVCFRHVPCTVTNTRYKLLNRSSLSTDLCFRGVNSREWLGQTD